MPSMKQTTKSGTGRASHYHIVYLNDLTGQGITSEARKHNHLALWQEETPAQQDPSGALISPAVPAGWLLQPAPDGHTHQITEYQGRRKAEPAELEEDVVHTLLGMFARASDREAKAREDAKEAWDFYKGEQWDKTLKSKLDKLERASLTINKIERNIDELSGYQREQRTDLRYTPIDDEGDQRIADILNTVAKVICNGCGFAREESRVFLDIAVRGRGAFNMYIDLNKDLRGTPVIERFPGDQIVLGPYIKDDASDCEYMFKHKLQSLAELKRDWGKKIDETKLKTDLSDYLTQHDQGEPHTSYEIDQYRQSENEKPVAELGGWAITDNVSKSYRLIECWQKTYLNSEVLFAPGEDFYFNASNWADEDVEAAATIPGMYRAQRKLPKVRITKIVGATLLSDENPADLPEDEFYLVPVHAKRDDDGYFWGKVKSVVDPQKEKNKRHSQLIDIGNKMLAYGWFYDASTFATPTEEKKFLDNSSSPGWAVKLLDVTRVPHKVEGIRMPSEAVQLVAISDATIDELMGIRVDEGGANTSGDALRTRIQNKLRGAQYLFDAMYFAKQQVGRRLVGMIQRYYSPQRILRILQSEHKKNPVSIADQTLDKYSESEILDLLQDADLTKVDVEVTEVAWGPTTRLITFALLSDLARAGLPISPDILIQYTDIPATEKKKVLDSIAAQQQSQQQAQSAKENSEIEKTLVAQGIVTPGLAQRMGIPAQTTPTQQPTPQAGPPTTAGAPPAMPTAF